MHLNDCINVFFSEKVLHIAIYTKTLEILVRHIRIQTFSRWSKVTFDFVEINRSTIRFSIALKSYSSFTICDELIEQFANIIGNRSLSG